MKKLICGILCGAALLAAAPAAEVRAEEIYPGYYSVTVVPTYQNPDTGAIDDVGQNPGIGTAMVQAQVQSVGYVEIYDDGSIYLNTRWNQADSNIYAGFETSPDYSQSWVTRDFEVTNQVQAGTYEFSGNTFSATITDYRLQLDTLNDTIRCSNYVEAMGREVTFFCYLTDIREYDGSWGTVEMPSMSEYTDSLNAATGGGYDVTEPQDASGGAGTAETTPTPEASATPAATPTPEATATPTPEPTSTPMPTIEEREVAEAKTADELLDEAEGIADLAEEEETETESVSGGSLVLGVVIGVVAGAAVVGCVLLAMKRKKKNYRDLFADVDDRETPDAQTGENTDEKK